MSRNIKEILRRRYGKIPEPTEGEKGRYSGLLEAGEILEYQEAASISKLGVSAQLSDDPDVRDVVLERYRQLTGKKLTSVSEVLRELHNYAP